MIALYIISSVLFTITGYLISVYFGWRHKSKKDKKQKRIWLISSICSFLLAVISLAVYGIQQTESEKTLVEEKKLLSLNITALNTSFDSLENIIRRLYISDIGNSREQNSSHENIYQTIKPIVNKKLIEVAPNTPDIKYANYLSLHVPNLEIYSKSPNYWLCFMNESYIYPIINLYGIKEIKGINVPNEFYKGSIILIEVKDEQLKEQLYEAKYQSGANYILKPGIINPIYKIKIDIKQ